MRYPITVAPERISAGSASTEAAICCSTVGSGDAAGACARAMPAAPIESAITIATVFAAVRDFPFISGFLAYELFPFGRCTRSTSHRAAFPSAYPATVATSATLGVAGSPSDRRIFDRIRRITGLATGTA